MRDLLLLAAATILVVWDAASNQFTIMLTVVHSAANVIRYFVG
ncbi:MAG TPA: hypothetical protein VMP03_15760 [Methylomirabilota bacterium]|nr:hypothetical protein [Methylomirabilota bacterium]